jgi:integrase
MVARLRHLLSRRPETAELRGWRAEQGRLALRIGRPSSYVLTDNLLQPWHPDVMSRAWVRDMNRALEEDIAASRMRMHDCRHWHATQLVAAGVDLNTVADRLGHATAAFTLAVYGHSDADRDQAAAQIIDRLVSNAISSRSAGS